MQIGSAKEASIVLGNGNSSRKMTSGANPPDFVSGREVCVSGAYSYDYYGYNQCGALTGSVSFQTDGLTLKDAETTSITTTRNGDSGAPVFDPSTLILYGIHKGLYGAVQVFSKDFYIEGEIYVRPSY